MLCRLAVRVQPGGGGGRSHRGQGQRRCRPGLPESAGAGGRPEDVAANAAAGQAAAEAPGAGKSAVRVVTGGKTRLKGLGIEGPPELAGVIEGWLADERSTD